MIGKDATIISFHRILSQEARAEEERMAARFANDIEIAKSQRDFELKKAAYDQEVHTKKATSDMAYDLQVQNFPCVESFDNRQSNYKYFGLW